MGELKRVRVLVAVFLAVLVVFLTGIYEVLNAPLQLVLLKSLLVCSGLLLAHVVRKALFPRVEWSDDRNWQHFLVVLSFYVAIPYCFAMGG